MPSFTSFIDSTRNLKTNSLKYPQKVEPAQPKKRGLALIFPIHVNMVALTAYSVRFSWFLLYSTKSQKNSPCTIVPNLNGFIIRDLYYATFFNAKILACKDIDICSIIQTHVTSLLQRYLFIHNLKTGSSRKIPSLVTSIKKMVHKPVDHKVVYHYDNLTDKCLIWM